MRQCIDWDMNGRDAASVAYALAREEGLRYSTALKICNYLERNQALEEAELLASCSRTLGVKAYFVEACYRFWKEVVSAPRGAGLLEAEAQAVESVQPGKVYPPNARRCAWCGKIFERKDSDCCCRSHAKKYAERSRQRKAWLSWRPYQFEDCRICVICGSHFVVARDNRNVCSEECYKALRRRSKG